MEGMSGADYRALVERAENTTAATTEPAWRGRLAWSSEEQRLLRTLYDEGKRPREMMPHFQRGLEAIQKQINKLELHRRDGIPAVKKTAYAQAGQTQAARDYDAREASVWHLIDLRRAFGVGPSEPHWIAVHRYRARCEWDNPPCSNTPLVSNPSQFRGSAEGSQAAMCADA